MADIFIDLFEEASCLPAANVKDMPPALVIYPGMILDEVSGLSPIAASDRFPPNLGIELPGVWANWDWFRVRIVFHFLCHLRDCFVQ